jgi:hypothetical protein
VESQCHSRWRDVLNCGIDRSSQRTGTWIEDEDTKLKDAVQMYEGKDWVVISALVPGRTRKLCNARWKNALDTSIDRVNGRTVRWTEDEDIKLKDAVQAHGGKNWDSIAALVSGRTRMQCWSRWHDALDISIDRAARRKGTWIAVEDSKLKDAVQIHGGKNWKNISDLVPGRTKKQCWKRWYDALNPSIALTAGRAGK